MTIRDWRIKNRYTRKQFADAVNISTTSLYLYERHGLGSASINTLLDIIAFTQMTFDEIDFSGLEETENE